MADSAKIFSLMFAIGRRMRDEGRGGKKTPAYSMLHFQTLRYVGEQGDPFMHDVAKYLCVTPPAATLLIDILVKDKLLARTRGKEDRRAVRLSLTRRGKAFLARGIEKKMKRLRAIFSALTPRERGDLIAILTKLAKKAAA